MFKSCRRTLALVMMLAVTLSAAVFTDYIDIKADTATEPAVRILGATLKTEGNENMTQSMRVGIEVSNASYADECGIKLKIKDSSNDYMVVSTANENYRKIYSLDAAEDKIVYTVVINNIPIEQAETNIKFAGYVKKIGTDIQTGSTETDTVYESLNTVLDKIGASANQTLEFDRNGNIISLVDSLNMTSQEEFATDGFKVGRDNEMTQYCTFDAAVGQYIVDYTSADDTDISNFDAAGYKGIGYRVGGGAKYIYRITVKSDDTTYIRLVPHWNGFMGDISGAGTIVSTGEWQTVDMNVDLTAQATGENYCLTIGDANTEWQGEQGCQGKYYIKQFDIYRIWSDSDMPQIALPATGWNEDKTEYSLKLDETSVLPNVNGSVVKNDNGSYTLLANGSEGYEVGFSFPEEIWSNYDFRTITVTYKYASGFTGVGIAKKYGTSSPWWSSTYQDDPSYGGGELSDGSGTKVFNVDSAKVVDGKYLSAFRFFSIPADATVTIESIVLSGLEQTEEATPTTAPTATPVPGESLSEPLTLSADICTCDGESVSVAMEDDILKLNLAIYQGVIINIPEDIYSGGYNYAEVTFSNPSGADVNLYMLNENMTDGIGQNPAGQQAPISIKEYTATTTVTYQLQEGSYIKALKYVSFAGSPTININSVVLKKDAATDTKDAIVMDIPDDYNISRTGVTYGTFKSDRYYSTYTDSERPFNVILPAGYSEDKKYPVVYMMHGIFGNQDSFGSDADSCSIVKTAGNLYAANEATEAIIVIPSIRVCTDSSVEDRFSAENYKFYDLFREDLINCLMPYMVKNYSIATGRENTAIAGFSMGGREALYIGITKPETFGYIGAFCPAYGIFAYEANYTGVGEEGLFSDTASFTLPSEYIDNTFIMIVKGSNDTTVNEMPTTYHEALESNGVSHVYYEVEGAFHDESAWGHGLYNMLRNVFK